MHKLPFLGKESNYEIDSLDLHPALLARGNIIVLGARSLNA